MEWNRSGAVCRGQGQSAYYLFAAICKPYPWQADRFEARVRADSVNASLIAENRFMSAMPRKRRLAVKAASVAMGQKETYAFAEIILFSQNPLRPCGRNR